MEIRSFLSGMFFLLGLQMLLPLVSVKVAVTIPGGSIGAGIMGVICLALAYYLFRGN